MMMLLIILRFTFACRLSQTLHQLLTLEHNTQPKEYFFDAVTDTHDLDDIDFHDAFSNLRVHNAPT